MCNKRVAKNKYGLSLNDRKNLKDESENNDANNYGENNSSNTNLPRILIFQVDTGKNVVWNYRK